MWLGGTSSDLCHSECDGKYEWIALEFQKKNRYYMIKIWNRRDSVGSAKRLKKVQVHAVDSLPTGTDARISPSSRIASFEGPATVNTPLVLLHGKARMGKYVVIQVESDCTNLLEIEVLINKEE